ncbi:MAG: hypothetical protein AB7V32_08980 [Candidatus Berkiella sp.]
MTKNPLARKISFLLLVKVALLICLWKISFSQPLSKNARQAGVVALFQSAVEKIDG